MTTSQKNTFLSETISAAVIPGGKLAYFRGRLANRIHVLVLDEFARLEEHGKLTRAELARRISRRPEQVTRWFGSAGNWTFDTLSDLLLGMGYELDLAVVDLRAESRPIPDADELAHISLGNLSAANDALGAYPQARREFEQRKPSLTFQAA